MKAIWNRIRLYFCRHDWRISRFQALNGGTSYRCAKCGRYLHLD